MQGDEAQRKFQLADRLYQEGNYIEALGLLDALDEAYPNTKNVMYPRACCLAKLGRREEALGVCEQLIARFDDPRAVRLKTALTDAAKTGIPQTPDIPGVETVAVSQPPQRIAKSKRVISRIVLLDAILIVIGLAAVTGFFLLIQHKAPTTETIDTALESQEAPKPAPTGGIPPGAVGRVALIIAVWITPVPALYLTFMLLGKLPRGRFSREFLGIGGVGLCIGILTVSLLLVCSAFGWIVAALMAFLLLKKKYDANVKVFLVFAGMVLALNTVFVGGVHYLFGYGLFDIPTRPTAEAPPQPQLPPGLEPQPSPPAGHTVPQANIVLDGYVDDWQNVPVFPADLEFEGSRTATDVQSVKLAHDSLDLYVLLAVGIDMGQEFQPGAGQTTRFLHITAEGDYCDLSIETGLVRAFGSPIESPATLPEARYTVAGFPPDTGKQRNMFSLDASEYPGYLCCRAQFIEIRVPMSVLGITPESRLQVGCGMAKVWNQPTPEKFSRKPEEVPEEFSRKREEMSEEFSRKREEIRQEMEEHRREMERRAAELDEEVRQRFGEDPFPE